MPKKRVGKKAVMLSNAEQKENRPVQSRKRKASGNDGAPPSKSMAIWGLGTSTSGLTTGLNKSIDGLGPPSSNGDRNRQQEVTPAVITISDSSQDSCSSSSSFHLSSVPGAPRILLNSQRENIPSCSNDSEQSLGTPVSHSTVKPVRIISQPQLQLGRNNLNKLVKKDRSSFDHFNTLSDEVMLHIFAWMPRFVLAKCARVCKRWSRLVLDESLWRRADLACKTLTAGVLGHLLNRGMWAVRLSQAEIESPIFTGISGISSPLNGTRLSKVQYLDLSMAGATPQVLEEILAICKDIRKLSLERLELNDTICTYIGENKHLEALNMAMCQGITANGLVPILSNCSKLHSLNMGWTNLHRHSVVYMCLCLPRSIRKLNISGCRENISNDEVLQLCKTCPLLLELDLSDCTELTELTLQHIMKHLSYIEHLALSRCYQIKPTSITDLSQIPSLLAVDVYGILDDRALNILRTSMTGIDINEFPFSNVARPTTGIRRTSIWGIRVRENVL